MNKSIFNILIILAVMITRLPAQTITVTTEADSGAGSLREAIASATAGATIVFDPAVRTILLIFGELSIRQDLTIGGGGVVTIARDSLAFNFRIFTILQGAVVKLSGLTITGGLGISVEGEDVSGGGIRNEGNLTLTNCTVVENQTQHDGGGIFNTGALVLLNCTITGNSAFDGGGLYTGGTVVADNSIFAENQVEFDGGGITNLFGGSVTLNNCEIKNNQAGLNEGGVGGGIENQGTMAAANCLIEANSTQNEGGGIYNDEAANLELTDCNLRTNQSSFSGGGIYNLGTLEIQGGMVVENIAESGGGGGIANYASAQVFGCAISHNTTLLEGGGGVHNYGNLQMIACIVSGNELSSIFFAEGSGGIENGGVLELRNCAVSGNRTAIAYTTGQGGGGGIRNVFEGTVSLINCTITGNEVNSSRGGGVENQGALFTIQNTIIAGNLATSANELETDIGGEITSLGYNLIGNTGFENFTPAVGDLSGAPGASIDPLFVMAAPPAPTTGGDFNLRQGSPAINAGSPDTSGLQLPADDLAGNPRILDSRIDIGAYEFLLRVITVDAPDSVAVGESPRISAEPPSDFFPSTSQVFYRRGGETFYEAMDLVDSGNNIYIADLPQSAVTIRGVEYYVSFSDEAQEITFPETNPQETPALIRVLVDSLESPLSAGAETYRMVSIPLELTDRNRSVLEVFGDDYGEYDPGQWRALRWQSGAAVYAEPPDLTDVFDAGNAFWLITREDQPFDVENGQSMNSADSAAVTAQPGWNQIGNPFAFSVDWNRVLNSSLVQAPVYWDGQQYLPPQFEMLPWEGYFVLNPNPFTVTLLFPPVESSGERLQKSEAAGESSELIPPPPRRIGASSSLTKRRGLKLPLSSQERGAGGEFESEFEATSRIKNSWATKITENSIAGEFILQIKLYGGAQTAKDEHNYVGMLSGALPGLDRRDFREPPAPVSENIRLSIIEDAARYYGNFLPPSAEGAYWDLQVSAAGEENVRLLIDPILPLPPEFQIWLLDTDAESALPVVNGVANIQLNGNRREKQLRLIAGTEDFAQRHNEGIFLEPLEFVLFQNYPNPFNPETTIRYQLAQRSAVQLEVYNLLGQKVVALVEEAQKAGRYSVSWDGRNSRGQRVASGVYIYRLTTETFVQTQKMVLTR